MSDFLNGIGKAVSKVVHRIDAPLHPCSIVGSSLDAKENRISHGDVWRGHIDFGTKDMGSVLQFSSPHPGKQVEVLFNRPAPVGTFFARFIQGTTIISYFICTQVAT